MTSPAQIKRWRRENPEMVREHHRRWMAANREKRSAYNAVYRALKAGRLERPDTCEIAGCRERPEAHHDDYSKPLDVRWLCRQHHAAVHYPKEQ
jgi:hypothetical protein